MFFFDKRLSIQTITLILLGEKKHQEKGYIGNCKENFFSTKNFFSTEANKWKLEHSHEFLQFNS